MNPVNVELALRKQRLQFKIAAQRGELAAQAAVIAPLLAAGDRIRSGVHWLRRHPELLVGVTVALLVARPRAMLRWARRAVVAWQAWGRLRVWYDRRCRAA